MTTKWIEKWMVKFNRKWMTSFPTIDTHAGVGENKKHPVGGRNGDSNFLFDPRMFCRIRWNCTSWFLLIRSTEPFKKLGIDGINYFLEMSPKISEIRSYNQKKWMKPISGQFGWGIHLFQLFSMVSQSFSKKIDKLDVSWNV